MSGQVRPIRPDGNVIHQYGNKDSPSAVSAVELLSADELFRPFEDDYNRIKYKVQKKKGIDILGILPLFGLLFSVIPLLPIMISDYLLKSLHISPIYNGYLEFSLWISLSAMFGYILNYYNKIAEEHEIDPHQKTFFKIQVISRRIAKHRIKETKIGKDTIEFFENYLDALRNKIDDWKRLEGVCNEVSIQHLEELAKSIEEKLIPALHNNHQIIEAQNVLYWLSYLHLHSTIGNNYRNNAQVILDTIESVPIPQSNIQIEIEKIRMKLKPTDKIIAICKFILAFFIIILVGLALFGFAYDDLPNRDEILVFLTLCATIASIVALLERK